MQQEQHYDAIIIGAGMSGLAAAIRLGMYDKKALVLESHRIPGGLNSYYKRGKREFDVGLHALTNFASKKEKGKPLTKLLKQLRIPYDDLKLNPQGFSQISFPDEELLFNNDIESLKAEIADKFPHEIDGFIRFLAFIDQYNEVALENSFQSARDVVSGYIKDKQLLEMIFCPILIYGSAWEHDIDFSQFVIMFKSIFLEGFGRPSGGVRTIISLLTKRLEEVGGSVAYGHHVQSIETHQGQVQSVVLKDGRKFTTDLILSSAGIVETYNLLDQPLNQNIETGKMSFTESILMASSKPKELDQKATIIFYSQTPKYHYRMPDELFDSSSAVLCFPNNFSHDDLDEGVYRATFMANYHLWKDLDRKSYLEKKHDVFLKSLEVLNRFVSLEEKDILFKDVFTPTTVKRYTHHLNGCVYGSPTKLRDGKTPIKGLVLCGTDQGFLGIIGSILSGVSMANLHGLMS